MATKNETKKEQEQKKSAPRGEKVSTSFKNTIKAYLDKRAAEDTLFAQTYAKENKNLDECCNYILQEVKKSGCCGFDDDEIYNMAIHYYDEDDIKDVKPVSAKVVVNHTVELSDEEKAEAKEKAKELKRQIAKAEKYEKQYKKHRGMFFGICFGNEHIVITVICSVKEMAEEGTMMHHCVYANGYYDHTKHPHSLILSAKDNEGNRLETIELNTKTWKVMQSRALQNGKTKFHDEIVKLVEQNIGLFKKAA